ncbi:hypothetical protein SAMN02746065_1278 [Desulfocicer vacuolatum DSM 3385]|uniref:Uncharacterized protein n=1 Tax=Desulfocicer vacuolatum DSM 3385 TaxID=1121400 RepID=A0A1W2EAA3_9BACT|nr:hypothetical protein SAMN02746065_1278 [Desulfocicer vacuolatum DSM 3385]
MSQPFPPETKASVIHNSTFGLHFKAGIFKYTDGLSVPTGSGFCY